MRKKKILFFSDCFIFGGCELVLVNLVNSRLLSDNFHLVYSYRKFKEYEIEVTKRVNNSDSLMPMILFSYESLIYKISNKAKVSFIDRIFIKLLVVLSRIGILNLLNLLLLIFNFRKINPDILYINNGGYPGSIINRLAVFAAKIIGINKIVFNVNNLALDRKYVIDSIIDKYIEKSVSIFVTASIAAKQRLSNARQMDINKIISIPNTVSKTSKTTINLAMFHETGDSIIVGSAGLLTKRKGFSVLIESFREVSDKMSDLNVKLVILGEGEERRNLEYLIDSLGLKGKVFLIGHKSNVLEYINSFDLFVVPSISNEDMPYVIIESMMLGKPIIGTEIAGIPEVILNNETGIIIKPNDKKQLANSIIKLVKDRKLREHFGNKGYARFCKSFEFDVVMKRYHELFIALAQ